jgi:hypothetical protein
MKNSHISSRLTRFILAVAAVLFICSCEKREGQLDFQILTHTMWYEAHNDSDSGGRLYAFDEGGMVSIYTMSGDAPLSGGEYHYIFTPAEELLAIETVGAFRVEDIAVEAISLKDIESGEPFRLTKYAADIELP